MSLTRICHLLVSEQSILLVFHNSQGFQFRLVYRNGFILGQTQIFHTEEAALHMGRRWLKKVSSS